MKFRQYLWMSAFNSLHENKYILKLFCTNKQDEHAMKEFFLQQIIYFEIFPLILIIFRFAMHIQSTKLSISRV